MELYPLSVGEDHYTSDYLFTVESLKESCGCLVTFSFDNYSEIETASLAHYTVREFLESDRLFGNALHFSLGPQRDYADLVDAIFNCALKARLDSNDPDSKSPNFSRQYCLASSFQMIRSHPQVKADPKLMFQFLTPNAPHLSVFLDYLRSHPGYNMWLEVATSQYIVNPSYFFWLWNWDSFNGSAIVGTFVMLMILRRDDLAELCLLQYGLKTILDGEFWLRSDGYLLTSDVINGLSGGHKRVLWFKGTVVEYFAAYGILDDWSYGPKPFDLCCQYGIGHIDFSNTLAYYATTHGSECRSCSKKYREDGNCRLEFLLAQGANPNPQGFELTPLQICCYRHDPRGIQVLLDAGADPNYIGQKGALEWDSDFILAEYAHLRGRSPLRIVKTSGTMNGIHEISRDDVAEQLLQRGAKDFDISESGNDIERTTVEIE